MKQAKMINSANDIFTTRLYKYYELKNKPFRRWLYTMKTKKFCKNIINASPGFETLWDMAVFIKNAESTFFYENNVNKVDGYLGLYSSWNYPAKQNGFKVSTEDCQVILKLYLESNGDKRLALEIENRRSEDKTNFIFVNNSWSSEHTKTDELLLDQVIQLINTQIIHLFEFCVDKIN